MELSAENLGYFKVIQSSLNQAELKQSQQIKPSTPLRGENTRGPGIKK